MEIGTCSCERGRNGSPCSHQAAIVFHYHTESLNFVPALHPSQRQEIAYLALGENANKDLDFYSALHEKSSQKEDTTTKPKHSNDTSEFIGSCWDIIRAGAMDNTIDSETIKSESITEILDQTRKEELTGKIDSLADIMKHHLDSNDPQTGA